jgi:hypothetical protein
VAFLPYGSRKNRRNEVVREAATNKLVVSFSHERVRPEVSIRHRKRDRVRLFRDIACPKQHVTHQTRAG